MSRMGQVMLWLFAAAFVAGARPAEAEARVCSPWHGTSTIRCLTTKDQAATGETVTVSNYSGQTVVFSMQKWFSACGMDAMDDDPTLKKDYQIEHGQEIVLSTKQSIGVKQTCTELFIADCRIGEKWVDCAPTLSAEIDLITPAPEVTPPLRRLCEAWRGGEEFRCLSSHEDAYQLEPVQVQNMVAQKVSFTVQEWYSLCGYMAEVPPTAKETHSLDSFGSLALPGREIPAEIAKYTTGACREIFIFDCKLGGAATPCTSLFHIEIGR